MCKGLAARAPCWPREAGREGGEGPFSPVPLSLQGIRKVTRAPQWGLGDSLQCFGVPRGPQPCPRNRTCRPVSPGRRAARGGLACRGGRSHGVCSTDASCSRAGPADSPPGICPVTRNEDRRCLAAPCLSGRHTAGRESPGAVCPRRKYFKIPPATGVSVYIRERSPLSGWRRRCGGADVRCPNTHLFPPPAANAVVPGCGHR